MTGVQTCALPICFPVTIHTYEEAKKELDDNDVDYNEQDLKDAWGIKENSEEENIGIKRRIVFIANNQLYVHF